MSEIFFQQPDGGWFVFSTVTDEFIMEDATREDVLEYKMEQYRQELERKLDEIEEEGGDWYTPPQEYSDLVERHRLHHGPTQECLDCGEDIPVVIDDNCPACGASLNESE